MFQSVIESELGELHYSGLRDFVMEKYSEVVVPTIPREGIPDCTPVLDAIGLLLIVLEYESRDLLFQNNAKRVPGEYFDCDVVAPAIKKPLIIIALLLLAMGETYHTCSEVKTILMLYAD